MASRIPNDILIPLDIAPVDNRPGKSRAVAFVPITLAVIGVAAILFGDISARDTTTAARQIDSITTGSIAH